MAHTARSGQTGAWHACTAFARGAHAALFAGTAGHLNFALDPHPFGTTAPRAHTSPGSVGRILYFFFFFFFLSFFFFFFFLSLSMGGVLFYTQQMRFNFER